MLDEKEDEITEAGHRDLRKVSTVGLLCMHASNSQTTLFHRRGTGYVFCSYASMCDVLLHK